MKSLSLSVLFGLMAVAATVLSTSCSDGKSYAEMLEDENKATNLYLAQHRVINGIPADSVFETVEDYIEDGYDESAALKMAPYYRMDDDGQIYMQVVQPGNRDDMAKSEQLIYFRFMRYNLSFYLNYDVWTGEGNAEDLTSSNASFRFGNLSYASSAQYGSGIQLPLYYLGINCEVNILIKSQYGFTSEIGNVIPYVYNIRYYKSQI